ncbi:MAG: DinB family protein [Gemmatimonadaceae bacterium]
MHPSLRTALPALALLGAFALSAHAQQASTVAADLRADIEDVEKKMLDLARAIPEDKYSWRPAAGVRSVGEVLLHVAADNYLIPAAIGFPADPATGIKGDDYKTAVAFEKRSMNKAATIAELEKSFAFVKKSLSETKGDRLSQPVSMFGMNLTSQKAWIMGTTHVHEHLGQLIAYARSNGIAPPWS